MKTLSTTIFLLFLIALGFTQVSTTEIEYGYDAAGNRILRRVITVGGGGMASKKGADTEQEHHHIRIWTRNQNYYWGNVNSSYKTSSTLLNNPNYFPPISTFPL